MWGLLDALLYFVGWWVPVVYFAGAGVVIYTVAGNDERVRNWLIGLFIAVYVLGLLLVGSWSNTSLDY